MSPWSKSFSNLNNYRPPQEKGNNKIFPFTLGSLGVSQGSTHGEVNDKCISEGEIQGGEVSQGSTHGEVKDKCISEEERLQNSIQSTTIDFTLKAIKYITTIIIVIVRVIYINF